MNLSLHIRRILERDDAETQALRLEELFNEWQETAKSNVVVFTTQKLATTNLYNDIVKMNLQPWDVLLFHVPDKMDRRSFQRLRRTCETMGKRLPGVTFWIVPESITLDKLDEKTMREAGWEKKV